MDVILLDTLIYLVAAVIAVPIAARLGLGSVLGYIAAGIVIGPVLGLVGSETKDLQHFAEYGVVVMLFLIGLELEPRTLWDMRHKLIGMGGLQITLTTGAMTALGMWYNYDWQTSLAVGMILSLSSTAIVLQTLTEKGLVQTNGGRATFSVLLTQDMAVIPMLAILPLLGLAAGPGFAPDGSIRVGPVEDAEHSAISLVDGLPAWGVTLITLGAVVAIILTGIYLTRPVFRYIHAAKLREMYTALALMIVVGIGLLMTMVGLSPALGTFLAGVVLANTEFRHELESDLEPFKGLLLGLFFITVGAGIDFGLLFAKPLTILGIAAAIILIKGSVLYIIARLFRLRPRGRWLFTLGLAQAGEFGFVLVSFSTQTNVLSAPQGQVILLAIAITMLITPLLFILFERKARAAAADAPIVEDVIDDKGPVIIAGIGRFGQIVNRLVQSCGYKTVVIDHDIKTIQLMRKFGFKGFFGDPTRPDLLRAAGLSEARILVVALDDPEKATRLVQFARKSHPKLHIIARAHDRNHVYSLYAAGADDIVRELFDSSLRAGRYVLENLGMTEFEAAEAQRVFYHHDRHTVSELAKLWKPDVPAAENEPYIARAKELEKELETTLLAQLETSSEANKKAS
ncbi:potassium transporter [Donghicola sp. C2-DW-16]|uniref:Potassium transporter n=1 Tax=Donghicola mangrovi TaxID=2729614 RepID=A0A850QG77_9RHOB|nr:monovalent cation:proton antiporter-2 (CPA2) family protein [Donghicola mangrovi]NVO24851.1 potassium transporter [Donghicola mangrovi]NVO29082.1 potassium transporter [Donghicola mangrovi]